MALKRRLDRLEKTAGPSISQDEAQLDMRSLARKIAVILYCGIEDPDGPAGDAGRAIARVLSRTEEKQS